MSATRKQTPTFKVKALHLALASAFTVLPVYANPTNPTVINGTVSMSTSGSTLTVNNTPGSIIHWQQFSINAGETTRFVQQSATSSVLNRVTGGSASQIMGALQSNGRVFVINPAGIVFGASAAVNVAGLVASSLDISNQDFLDGKMKFAAGAASLGDVTNAGNISTPNGGFVYIVAPKVENTGVITTPSGEAVLAAGHSVELVDSADPNLRVVVNAPTSDVNLSQIMANASGDIYQVLNSGKISANTAVVGANGRVYLKSAGNIETTATSVIEAKGDTTMDGGHIQAFADKTGIYKGSFDASGRSGGFIETSASDIDFLGINVSASALDPAGKKGKWLIDPDNITINNISVANTFASTLGSGYGADVELDTTGAGTDAGNISISVAIDSSFYGGGTGDLILRADNNIIITAPITVGGSVDMESGRSTSTGYIDINSTITAGNLIDLETKGNGNIIAGYVSNFYAKEIHLKAGNQISLTSAYFYASGGTDAKIDIEAPDIYSSGSILSASGGGGVGSIDIDSLGPVNLYVTTIQASGNGGSLIDIDAGSLLISGSNSVQSTSNNGNAIVEIKGNSVVIDGPFIAADAFYGGQAIISIDGNSVQLINADLQADSDQANAVVSITGSQITMETGAFVGAYAQTSALVAIGKSGSTIQIDQSSVDSNSFGGYADTIIDGAAVTISGNSNISADSQSSGAYVGIGGSSSLSITNSYVSASGYSGGYYDGSIGLKSPNILVQGSELIGKYIGINYPGPEFIEANSQGFFDFISNATVNITDSYIGGYGYGYGFGAIGIGFGGRDVTITNSTLTADLMHGIATGKLQLIDNASLNANLEMLLEAGTGIYLDNNSSITVGSPFTLYFNFPYLVTDGWYLDGVAGIFTGSNGSTIRVVDPITGILGEPILGTNFFVTYGGGQVIQTIINQSLYNPDDTLLLALDETEDDDDDEEGGNNQDQPRECS